ncbi:DUF6090 family protein [Hanstruepera marina]|uniref:DUF6090 family protein n=1 Tax=Hanstruepera marina TaxID=2873265 RepID=UPI001CA68F17|nr:DUF6090 family protein [Hanstruepera marina]
MESKTSKYFKYAIGEIILVVIGILIALQINNWNERKKLKTQEKEALVEIISDLNINVVKFNQTLNGKNRLGNINNALHSLNVIIEHLKSKEVYHDSLDKHFGIMTFSVNNINYKTSGYESLSSIGLGLIKNTKLRSEIGEYYTSSIEIPKSVSIGLIEDFNNYMLDYIRKDFITNDNRALGIYTLHPRNYNLLREKGDYLESLKAYLSVYETYKYEIKNAIEASNTLKNSIETYLKN